MVDGWKSSGVAAAGMHSGPIVAGALVMAALFALGGLLGGSWMLLSPLRMELPEGSAWMLALGLLAVLLVSAAIGWAVARVANAPTRSAGFGYALAAWSLEFGLFGLLGALAIFQLSGPLSTVAATSLVGVGGLAAQALAVRVASSSAMTLLREKSRQHLSECLAFDGLRKESVHASR